MDTKSNVVVVIDCYTNVDETLSTLDRDELEDIGLFRFARLKDTTFDTWNKGRKECHTVKMDSFSSHMQHLSEEKAKNIFTIWNKETK